MLWLEQEREARERRADARARERDDPGRGRRRPRDVVELVLVLDARDDAPSAHATLAMMAALGVAPPAALPAAPPPAAPPPPSAEALAAAAKQRADSAAAGAARLAAAAAVAAEIAATSTPTDPASYVRNDDGIVVEADGHTLRLSAATPTGYQGVYDRAGTGKFHAQSANLRLRLHASLVLLPAPDTRPKKVNKKGDSGGAGVPGPIRGNPFAFALLLCLVLRAYAPDFFSSGKPIFRNHRHAQDNTTPHHHRDSEARHRRRTPRRQQLRRRKTETDSRTRGREGRGAAAATGAAARQQLK